MPVTARQLMADPRLGLATVRDGGDLDRPLGGVAVTEQPDPAPWLNPDDLVLTSGMWLTEARTTKSAARTWADQVRSAGATVVGFGLDPWFPEVPRHVADAAHQAGLTLLSVPPTTPFVAISRKVSDLFAVARSQATAEATRIQQRLAVSAREGRTAVVRRLARELRAHVALVSGDGTLVAAAPHADGEWTGWAASTARRIADSGQTSASEPSPRGEAIAVAVGDPGHPPGVLFVAGSGDHGAGPDPPGWRAGIAGTAAALCAALDPATQPAGRAVATLLARGDTQGAEITARVVGSPLPSTMRAVAIGGRRREEAARQAAGSGAWWLPAEDNDACGSAVELLLASPALAETQLPSITSTTGCPAGVSTLLPAARMPEALRQAVTALEAARPSSWAAYEETAGALLEPVLRTAEVDELAQRVLARVPATGRARTLLRDAEVWLRNRGRWDPAATELAVHRETLRRRIRRVAELTGLDLDEARGRLVLSLVLDAVHHRDTGGERSVDHRGGGCPQ